MKDIKQIIREELQKVVAEETIAIEKGEAGDCYKNVQDYLLDNDIPNAVIVHGVVTSRNGTLNHAWIETDTEVYDPTTGIKTDKETYYAKLNPKVDARYTFPEAMKKRFSQGNYGPWTESLVTEVGEANVSPYTWQKKSERINDGGVFMYVYTFTTEDGDNYITEIQNISNYENKKGSWTISFETTEHDMYQTVNKGRVFRVMSTILNILKDFIKTEDPNEIIIHPTKGSQEKEAGENKRLVLYTQYIKKNLPINYYIASMGTVDFPEIVLRKKSQLGVKNLVREELEELLGQKPIHVYEEGENFFPLATNVSLVTEVGEGTAKAYRIYDDYIDTLFYGHAQFHFITESNRKHTVKFKSSKLIEYDEWTVTFKESSGGIAYDKPTEFTGGTNVYRIFATYLEIIEYFLALKDPDVLAFLNFGEQKYNIFMQYLKRNMPMDYEISDNDKYDFMLVRTDFEEKTDHLLENMNIKKIIQEVVWNPDFKNSMITDKDIIGKSVGEAFQGYDGIELIANKTITYAKLFQGGGHIFEGMENADDFLETEGYIRGRMMEQGNFPVPFVKKGKLKRERFPLTGAMLDVIPTKTGENEFLYDTYWDMLDINAINLLDGVLLSEDYDHKEVHVIFFNFPMNESKKKKKKQLTMALPIGKIFTAGGSIGENEIKSHIMTREEFTKIVQEEINKLNESPQILTIRDLAELGTRTGYDFETFLEIYQDAFRRGGDEEVVKVAESMLKQKVYVLSKGKYTLSPVTGGEY